jgi:hypothetical protein
VRLGARADRVRREAFEEDQRGDDQQAEAEQPPVGRRAPNAATAERAQGFFLWPDPWPGTVTTPGTVATVVVGVVVVVVARFPCPGALADLPRTGVVRWWPGAAPERPGDVVVLVVVFVVWPGAIADLPGVLTERAGVLVAPAPDATGAGSAGTRSAGAGAAGFGT